MLHMYVGPDHCITLIIQWNLQIRQLMLGQGVLSFTKRWPLEDKMYRYNTRNWEESFIERYPLFGVSFIRDFTV